MKLHPLQKDFLYEKDGYSILYFEPKNKRTFEINTNFCSILKLAYFSAFIELNKYKAT